jgi:hypothetical protein
MVAKAYGQPPHTVATWPEEWLVAAITVMEAEAAASNERQLREQRRARIHGAGRGR